MNKRMILLGMALLLAMTLSAQSLFVGTYNVRNQNDDDARNGNGWPRRCEAICGLVNFESPDIFGTQEVLVGQLHDLLKGLDHYDYVGVGRDDGKEAGEYSAIFYRKDRLRLVRDGHFWLSETPEKPGLGWDAVCVRICTWGEFEQTATKKRFFFFTLHTDHVGVKARREAMHLVLSRIKTIAKGAPVVVTGDFNVDQNDESYTILAQSGLLKDSYASARLRFAENGTYNAFRPDASTPSRIDHIFVSPSLNVDRYAILTDSYWTPIEGEQPDANNLSRSERRNPSDHYPVFAHLSFGE